MPRRRIVFSAVSGEARDMSRTSPARQFLKKLVGFNPGPVAFGVNKLVSVPGSDLLNNKLVMRAPITGGTGEDSADMDLNSDPDTMTLVMMSDPRVRGNIFVNVFNGNGAQLDGATSGHQGYIPSVYQAIWPNNKRLDLRTPDFTSPVPASPPGVLGSWPEDDLDNDDNTIQDAAPVYFADPYPEGWDGESTPTDPSTTVYCPLVWEPTGGEATGYQVFVSIEVSDIELGTYHEYGAAEDAEVKTLEDGRKYIIRPFSWEDVGHHIYWKVVATGPGGETTSNEYSFGFNTGS